MHRYRWNSIGLPLFGCFRCSSLSMPSTWWLSRRKTIERSYSVNFFFFKKKFFSLENSDSTAVRSYDRRKQRDCQKRERILKGNCKAFQWTMLSVFDISLDIGEVISLPGGLFAKIFKEPLGMEFSLKQRTTSPRKQRCFLTEILIHYDYGIIFILIKINEDYKLVHHLNDPVARVN